jgi:hypothetical protein
MFALQRFLFRLLLLLLLLLLPTAYPVYLTFVGYNLKVLRRRNIFIFADTEAVVYTRAVESQSEGILGGVGVGKNVPSR